jgi:hypothetical protein
MSGTDNGQKRFCGVKGKSGPARGNLNGLKNGSKLGLKRLTVGELPKQLISVRREGRAYRRAIEAEVLRARGGEISATAAHHIDTASAATIHAGICRWLLRNKIGEMTTSDILACSREITKAKQARDAAIKALELDTKDPMPWIEAEPVHSNNDGAGGTDK